MPQKEPPVDVFNMPLKDFSVLEEKLKRQLENLKPGEVIAISKRAKKRYRERYPKNIPLVEDGD